MAALVQEPSAHKFTDWAALASALLVAAALKLSLVLAGAVPFNSDEAVVALMARHILQGERPVFFYGQAYMGSLDAWLVAGAFRLFGEGVFAVRLVQIGLYLLYLVTLWLLARRLFSDRRIANAAVWIAAVPTVLVTTYTTASLGGYGETLVLGNLILWLGHRAVFSEKETPWNWLALGLVGGIAIWTLALAGVYLFPVFLLLVWAGVRSARRSVWWNYVLLVLSFLAGSSPWWLYNIAHSGAALAALTAGTPIPTTFLQRLTGLVLLGLTTLFGLRFPWTAELSPIPEQLLGVSLYLAAAVYALRWMLGYKKTIPQPVLPLSTEGLSAPTGSPDAFPASAGSPDPAELSIGFSSRDLAIPTEHNDTAATGMPDAASLSVDLSRRDLAIPTEQSFTAERSYTAESSETAPAGSPDPAAVDHQIRRGSAPGARSLLGLLILGFGLAFLGTQFGVDATGRYLLPLSVPVVLALAALTAGVWQRRAAFGAGLLGLLLLLNGMATWRAARSPDLITTQFDPVSRFDNRYDAELIDFLRQHRELSGYTNYWVSFRLAFLSNEELIYAARLPYKLSLRWTPGDSRYPPYAQRAAASPTSAYITSKHPVLDQLLSHAFGALDIAYQETQIGDFHIFYDLSRAVAPDELGLGLPSAQLDALLAGDAAGR